MKKIKITNNAPIILAFSLASLAALILHYLTGGKSTNLLFMSYHSSLASPLTYVRFFTHALGHAGWQHFLGNISMILLLGPMLEEKYGSKKILAIMLITAFTAGVANYILFPRVGIMGASGIVFAFIMLTSYTSFREGEIPITVILVALIFIGQEIWSGITVSDNVSNFSHILGGITGSVIGYRLNVKKKAEN
ncbi:MAG: rhomboid family intramembrane serine protease [Oscillospiraceae bacterium]|nr:rhomboid family intramembrane serine protease [Oscillospiraceae bacterium]